MDPTWSTLSLPGRMPALKAFTAELIREIGKLEELQVSLYDTSWDRLFFGLQKGQDDAILSTMEPYLFYEKTYDFSEPILLTGPTVVIRTEDEIKSLDDFSGKEVAILRLSKAALILEKYPEITQKVYESVPEALNAVAAGEVDGAAIDILTASAFCTDLYQGQLKIAFPPLNREGIRLTLLHDHAPELLAKFNHGLKQMEKSGKLLKLAQKWSLSAGVPQ